MGDLLWNLTSECLLRHPFSQETRDARRSLFVTSVVLIVLVRFDVAVRTFRQDGIELTASDPQLISKLLAVAVLYFLVVFLLYALVDLTSRALALSEAANAFSASQSIAYTDVERATAASREILIRWLVRRRQLAFILAATSVAVEVLVPTAAGFWSLWLFVHRP